MTTLAGRPLTHWLAIGGVLTVCVGIGFQFSGPNAEPISTATHRPSPRPDTPQHANAQSGDAVQTRLAEENAAETSAKEVRDIFAVRTWEPPPPPLAEVKPAPPPPPQAPPLPFQFLGRIADGTSGTAYLLKRGDEVLTVALGEDIDALYHVDKLEAGQLQILYKPLHIRQFLAIGNEP